MENLRRDTWLLAAVTQLELSSWFQALNLSFSIYHVNLRGGTSFALPVPLVSLGPSARPSRRLISPHFLFPTLLCPPPCDPVSHCAVPLFSLRSGYTSVGAGESRTSSAWGRRGLPEAMGTHLWVARSSRGLGLTNLMM